MSNQRAKKYHHPALGGPTQAERRASPTYIILEFGVPVDDIDLENVMAGDMPDCIIDGYRAYDNGFGFLTKVD